MCLKKGGIDRQQAINIARGIVTDVERAVVPVAGDRGVGIVRFPGHESIDLAVFQRSKEWRSAGGEADGLNFGKISTAKPRARLEQQFRIAVGSRAQFESL